MNFMAVVMNVADLNRSIDFYREVLGFTVLSQGANGSSAGLRAVTIPRSLCCGLSGAVRSEELAISVCGPSYWKLIHRITWSRS